MNSFSLPTQHQLSSLLHLLRGLLEVKAGHLMTQSSRLEEEVEEVEEVEKELVEEVEELDHLAPSLP